MASSIWFRRLSIYVVAADDLRGILGGWKARHQLGWICDRVVLFELREGHKQIFQFDRSRRDLAATLVSELDSASKQQAASEATLVHA